MGRGARKFTLDSNLYVDAFRNTDAKTALERFHAAFTPFEYLSAVVAEEIRAGVRPDDAPRLERDLFGPFERRNRIITPSYSGWKQSGELLSTLAASEGLELRRVSKTFFNDIILAITCRENGVTLVTNNVKDFARIKRVLPTFVFVPPWPVPPA